jgi:RimJ/RimL family protein N-acetyltransferase
MKLETKRLIIRPIETRDKQAVFEYRSNKDANKFQGWIPSSIEDVEEFISKVSNKINIAKTWFQFVIIEKDSRKLIGDLGIHFFDDENQQVELGCTINKEYQNRGYATESLKTVIDYLFEDLNKHRIIASIDPDNQNSIMLMEKLEFRKEAHFVESLFLNGKWHDDVIYAILNRDWRN